MVGVTLQAEGFGARFADFQVMVLDACIACDVLVVVEVTGQAFDTGSVTFDGSGIPAFAAVTKSAGFVIRALIASFQALFTSLGGRRRLEVSSSPTGAA